MPTATVSLAARLRPTLARLAHAPATDADLLADFVAARDEDAFAELVRRHGPAVLAVCRRITRNPHDADDAFQAAFLVLAKKADRVRPGEPLAGWLYGVAVRAARAALSRSYRRRSRETPVGELPDVPARTAEPFDGDDARAVLAEVERLSAEQRAAVVLCELEGRSRAAAARELGIPEGTLSSRLAAARKVLAARLRDRGLAAAVLAAVAACRPSPAHAASVWTSGVSSRVTELTEAVMRTGFSMKLAGVLSVAVAAAVGLVAANAGPPVAVTEAPAPRPADPSRLIVGFAGHVRYLTPVGQEVGRVTGDQVKAAGADIHTKSMAVGIGPRGLEFPVSEIFAPAGRAAPDGQLPLHTRKGLYLLAAGPEAVVTPVMAKGGKAALFAGKEPFEVMAWSPDGKRAVGWATEYRLLGADKHVHTLIDLASGTATPLNLPAGHRVLDWSPDGTWFLTQRTEESFSWFGGGSHMMEVCRVSADGKRVEVLADAPELVWYAAISPDGAKMAYARSTTVPVEHRGKTIHVFNGIELVVLDLGTMTRAAVLAARGRPALDCGELAAGVRWSPDGSRLAVATRVSEPGQVMWNRVRVCDADGGNARVVFETDRVKWETMQYPTAFDWR